MKKLLLISAVLFLGLSTIQAQKSAKDIGFEAVNMATIQGQLEFLASDWTQGRETGTDGAYMAADYIASMFKVWGLSPGGDMEQRRMSRSFRRGGPPPAAPKRTYFQYFNLVETYPGETQEFSVVTKNEEGFQSIDFNYKTDFTISGGSTGMAGEVPVVFVGYGLKDDDKGYDDFKGLDLKGKIVVKLSGFPGHKAPDSKAYAKFKPEVAEEDISNRARYMRMYGRRGGFAWARERGVLAVISVNPNSDPTSQWVTNLPVNAEINGPARSSVRKSLRRMGNDLGQASINFTITQRVVNELVSGLDINFDDLEKKIAESGKPASRVLEGKFIKFKTTIHSSMVRVRNVIGVLEGKDTTNAIVIGGHYDHLGVRDGWVYNGADDNASGTVGVMTIAKAMMATGEKPEKTIIFSAWTGEEKGLIGSGYFVDHHYDYNILCNLNYDMISRNSPGEDQDKKISMTFTSTTPIFKELAEKHNADYELDLDINFKGSPQPGGGSDHAPFAKAGIPVFYFMAGFPPEYHQPGDHLELVKWDKMLKIVKLGYLNIYELANQDWK
ncbi:MAG: M20/M25/M40 family metallo-hydrolase [Bacteroidales bacterium]|nr:M20/M25/M40 family metallo-hydrolase [Bacteroidales bacterium]